MSPNRGFTYTGVVPPRQEGRGVLDYLCERYPHSSRSEWEARLREGRVRLDGHPADPLQRLRGGQHLAWERPPWEEPPAPLVYALLHRDADLLAVAKPAGLPTLPGAGFLDHTLLSLVRGTFPEAAPAHRLGRGTSGVMLFGRTPKGRAGLSLRFRERAVLKCYRALIQGWPQQENFTIEAPIGPVPHPSLGTIHAAVSGGRPARSEVRVLERRDGESLVEVRIRSGRPHQIRIHLAACGHPLVGDPVFADGGLPLPGEGTVPGETGYHLHAWRVSLRHPTQDLTLEIECRPPRLLRLAGEP